MLVLSRKISEQVLIPELNITITIVKIGANRVQLGINAPEHIQVTRPEAQRPRQRDSSASTRTVLPCDPPLRTAVLSMA